MEAGLLSGFVSALAPENLFYCFLGTLIGTVVGVIPALGPAATIAMLLPLTAYHLEPLQSIVVLSGIYYGAMYGGSITSILMNIPGEAASVPTCLDGYEMTKQGRAGEALAIAAIGSFIAGTAGVLLLSFVAPALADFALRFGPPEYFGITFFSLAALFSFSGKSLLKGLSAGLAGMVLATIGIDSFTATQRLTFGSPSLMAGLDIVAVVIGLFGVAEVLSGADEKISRIYDGKLGRMIPRGKELVLGLIGSVRGALVGLVTGLLPGLIPTVVTFIAYDLEKRVSRRPEKFGKGAIEGVAAPEAANNGNVQAGFVPLFALGIPTTPVAAMLLASLMIYGLPVGPTLFTQHAEFTWAVIASMYIGNVFLLVLNLPLVGLWARLCLIPYRILGPVTLGVVIVGAYSVRNNMFDVWTALCFGIIGYAMKKLHWPAPPLILGFILGPIFESNLRASMQMSNNSALIFFERPICLFFILLGVAFMALSQRVLITAREVEA